MSISATGLLMTIIIGILAGWVAGLITKGRGFGLVLNLVFGVVGAFVGTWIFGLLGFGIYNTIGLFIAAVVGAIVVIFIVGLIRSVTKNNPP